MNPLSTSNLFRFNCFLKDHIEMVPKKFTFGPKTEKISSIISILENSNKISFFFQKIIIVLLGNDFELFGKKIFGKLFEFFGNDFNIILSKNM